MCVCVYVSVVSILARRVSRYLLAEFDGIQLQRWAIYFFKFVYKKTSAPVWVCWKNVKLMKRIKYNGSLSPAYM